MIFKSYFHPVKYQNTCIVMLCTSAYTIAIPLSVMRDKHLFFLKLKVVLHVKRTGGLWSLTCDIYINVNPMRQKYIKHGLKAYYPSVVDFFWWIKVTGLRWYEGGISAELSWGNAIDAVCCWMTVGGGEVEVENYDASSGVCWVS